MKVITPKSQRRALATICIANLAYAFSSSLLGPSLPTIISSLSLNAWEVGSIASVGAIGFLSVLPGGFLADKKGKKKLMLAGLFIESFGYFLTSASQNFIPLILSLAIFGVGAGIWEVAVSSFVPDTFSNPNGAMNILHSTWGIGGFMGPLLVGIVISTSRDWQQSFLISAFFLSAAIVIILSLKDEGHQGKDSDLNYLNIISSMPKGAVVALALGWGVELGLYTYLPILLESERGFETIDASTTLGILLLMIAIGRIVWSKLSGSMGVVNTVKISGIFAGISILATAITTGHLILLPVLSTGFFISSLVPTILAYIGDRTMSSRTGAMIGLTLSAASIGGAIISASPALIAEWTGMSFAFVFLGILLLTTYLLMHYPSERTRKFCNGTI